MLNDVVDLRQFYLSPLGLTTRRLLRARLAQIWPQVANERVLAIGYPTPLLRGLRDGGAKILAFMPAQQGVVAWPKEGPNCAALVDPAALPLPDDSVDRVLLLHALEYPTQGAALLREAWRVLKGRGQLLAVVPNRRGIWARSDLSPFGDGQPFSPSQLKDMLRNHCFLPERTWRALYLPPLRGRLLLGLADRVESWGARLFPTLGGVLMMEASKQLYAPAKPLKSMVARQVVLPKPATVNTMVNVP